MPGDSNVDLLFQTSFGAIQPLNALEERHRKIDKGSHNRAHEAN